jgi:hypothetical protein
VGSRASPEPDTQHGRARGSNDEWRPALITSSDFAFFGAEVRVLSSPQDAEDLEFFFRPHGTDAVAQPACMVELYGEHGFLRSLLAKDNSPKSFRVRLRADGPVVQEMTFTKWSATPSPIPPFTLLRDKLGLVQATVLTDGRRCVALCGPPHSGKTSLGLELASHDWSLVSDQLLVVERATGLVRPYLTPLGLRGRTLARLRSRIPEHLARRSTLCSVSGEVVLVRPEALVATVDAQFQSDVIHLIHVTRNASEASIAASNARPKVWPTATWSWLAGRLAPRNAIAALSLPPGGSEKIGAGLVEEYLHA